MKAWRKKAEAVNKRKAEGSKEPSARVQMQQARHVSRMFKPKGSGNWLIDALLLNGGFKAAVYGDINPKRRPLNFTEGSGYADPVSLRQTGKSWFNTIIAKTKAWWNS